MNKKWNSWFWAAKSEINDYIVFYDEKKWESFSIVWKIMNVKSQKNVRFMVKLIEIFIYNDKIIFKK